MSISLNSFPGLQLSDFNKFNEPEIANHERKDYVNYLKVIPHHYIVNGKEYEDVFQYTRSFQSFPMMHGFGVLQLSIEFQPMSIEYRISNNLVKMVVLPICLLVGGVYTVMKMIHKLVSR
jgi:Endoplasmic reticulum vesicle transporter